MGGSESERMLRVLEVAQSGDEERIRALLEREHSAMDEELANDLKVHAAANWDAFYSNVTTNFYKDRHYLRAEFPEIMSDEVRKDPSAWCDEKRTPSNSRPDVAVTADDLDAMRQDDNKLIVVCEIGAAVGNSVFPLIRANPHVYVYACDFSSEAISLLRKHDEYNTDAVHGFVCDMTTDHFNEVVPMSAVDFCTMIFFLSCIGPAQQEAVVKRVFKVLRPGGMVLFRDYAENDLAMLRYKAGRMIEVGFYARGDGTFAYYFTMDRLATVFQNAGFTVLENEYRKKTIHNHKRGISMNRIWIQGKFQKPA